MGSTGSGSDHTATIGALLFAVGMYFLMEYRGRNQPRVDNARYTMLMDASRVKTPYMYGPEQLRTLATLEYRIHLRFVEEMSARSVDADVTKAMANTPLLQAWISDYESSSASLLVLKGIPGFEQYKQPEEVIAGHPILVYRMMRRFNREFRDIIQKLGNTTREMDIRRFISSLQLELRHDWPDEEDLNDVIDAILKIHDVYDLRVPDVVNGTFRGVHTEVVALDNIHIMEIATHAEWSKQFVLAFQWFYFGLQRSPAADHSQILERLQQLMELHNANWEEHSSARGPERFGYFTQKLTDLKSISFLTPTVKGEEVDRAKGNRTHTHTRESDLANYFALCSQKRRNDIVQARPPRRGSQQLLRCWLDNFSTRELWVFPSKVEELNHDPPILKIHDAISTKTADRIEELASSAESRQYVEVYVPKTHSEDNHKPRYYKSRIAASSLVPENPEDPAIRLLLRRMEAVTNLKVVDLLDPGNLDFVSYSPGGHLGVQHDTVGSRGRIATILFNFNEVILGGRIVFPRLGISVEPDPGSAILWFNILPETGQPDWRTHHGSCPVILGPKSGVSKYIKRKRNYARMKCQPKDQTTRTSFSI